MNKKCILFSALFLSVIFTPQSLFAQSDITNFGGDYFTFPTNGSVLETGKNNRVEWRNPSTGKNIVRMKMHLMNDNYSNNNGVVATLNGSFRPGTTAQNVYFPSGPNGSIHYYKNTLGVTSFDAFRIKIEYLASIESRTTQPDGRITISRKEEVVAVILSDKFSISDPVTTPVVSPVTTPIEPEPTTQTVSVQTTTQTTTVAPTPTPQVVVPPVQVEPTVQQSSSPVQPVQTAQPVQTTSVTQIAQPTQPQIAPASPVAPPSLGVVRFFLDEIRGVSCNTNCSSTVNEKGLSLGQTISVSWSAPGYDYCSAYVGPEVSLTDKNQIGWNDTNKRPLNARLSSSGSENLTVKNVSQSAGYVGVECYGTQNNTLVREKNFVRVKYQAPEQVYSFTANGVTGTCSTKNNSQCSTPTLKVTAGEKINISWKGVNSCRPVLSAGVSATLGSNTKNWDPASLSWGALKSTGSDTLTIHSISNTGAVLGIQCATASSRGSAQVIYEPSIRLETDASSATVLASETNVDQMYFTVAGITSFENKPNSAPVPNAPHTVRTSWNAPDALGCHVSSNSAYASSMGIPKDAPSSTNKSFELFSLTQLYAPNSHPFTRPANGSLDLNIAQLPPTKVIPLTLSCGYVQAGQLVPKYIHTNLYFVDDTVVFSEPDIVSENPVIILAASTVGSTKRVSVSEDKASTPISLKVISLDPQNKSATYSVKLSWIVTGLSKYKIAGQKNPLIKSCSISYPRNGQRVSETIQVSGTKVISVRGSDIGGNAPITFSCEKWGIEAIPKISIPVSIEPVKYISEKPFISFNLTEESSIAGPVKLSLTAAVFSSFSSLWQTIKDVFVK